MTPIRADRNTYALDRRYKSKKGGKPLKGFALDVTIRFNTHGTPFVQDHNSDGGPMPFDDIKGLQSFLSREIERNWNEHYGTTSP